MYLKEKNAMSSWIDAAQSFKKAILLMFVGQRMFTINLCGQPFRVVYETRKARQDRDYPILKKLAENKSCILDIGTNLGLASLIMATSMSENGKIYALDASEVACRIAQENIALNKFEYRVQVIEAVVADINGQPLDFYWAFSSGGASLVSGYLGHTYPLRKIAISIDAFCNHNAIKPDLIKIDVEGAERRVLIGMKNVLIQSHPIVFMELHQWQDMTVASNAASMIPVLDEVGYKMIYLRTKAEIEDTDILLSRGRCHVLLIPRDTLLPESIQDFDTSRL